MSVKTELKKVFKLSGPHKINFTFGKCAGSNFFNFGLLLFWTLFFRLALEVSYEYFVSVVYPHEGYLYLVNGEKYFESWFVVLCVFFSNPFVASRPSHHILTIAYYFFIVPFSVYYSLANMDRDAFYLIIFQYLIILWISSGRVEIVQGVNRGPIFVRILVFVSIIFATAWMIAVVGFSRFNLDLSNVYDFRHSTSELLNSWGMGYLVYWTTNVFGIVLLVSGLANKNVFIVAVSLLLFVVWFGLTSYKSVLFYPLIVILLYYVTRYTKSLYAYPLSLSFLPIISLLDYYLFDDVMLGSLALRRIFFVPSNLAFNYIDFFSINPYVMWSNSIFSNFIWYPYGNLSTASVVGNYIDLLYGLNDPDLWANSSFFATGYMHGGILGMLFYSVVVGVILKIVNIFAVSGVPIYICVTFTFVPFYILFLSSDLFTALLSHGLGVSLLILYFLVKKYDFKNSH